VPHFGKDSKPFSPTSAFPELATEVLLMHVLGRDRSYLYSHPDEDVPPAVVQHYSQLIAERATGKPTQYIVGHQAFWASILK